MIMRYLLFVSVAYSYPILRPLQAEIRRRGQEVAWYIEPDCPVFLLEDEKRLATIQEVMDYNPVAVFAPGTSMYDFFPGVKVSVGHGYPINKRAEKRDEHFNMRGWFDIYCAQGPSSYLPFKELEAELGYFKVYETGWCKVDSFVDAIQSPEHHARPVVLYATTFTRSITSAPLLIQEITRMAKEQPWDWLITFHPKYKDMATIEAYRNLALQCPHVTVHEGPVDVDLLKKADVMLCDASSIIVEFMLLNKPVVTFRNNLLGKGLLNVDSPKEVEGALKQAIERPEWLMDRIKQKTAELELGVDGKASARILDAVDDFLLNYKGKLKPKPLNLVRKLKLRRKVGYYKW